MVNIINCLNLDSPYWNLVNFFLAVFATAISIGYLLKPRIHYCAFIHDNKWKVRVINKNIFFSVKEIQCEIAVSETKCFSKEKTVELKKDKTLVLKIFKKESDDYIFRAKSEFIDIQQKHRELMGREEGEHLNDYKFLRIRLLVPNFMGVKKHYKRIYIIENLEVIVNDEKPEPLSQCKHKRAQKQELANLENQH
jgi:hypothetical protein